MSQALVPIQCGGSGPASALSIFNATLDAPVDTSLTDNKQLVLGTKFMMQVGWAGWVAGSRRHQACCAPGSKKRQHQNTAHATCYPCLQVSVQVDCRPHSKTSTSRQCRLFNNKLCVNCLARYSMSLLALSRCVCRRSAPSRPSATSSPAHRATADHMYGTRPIQTAPKS